jgi:hypothetical protein
MSDGYGTVKYRAEVLDEGIWRSIAESHDRGVAEVAAASALATSQRNTRLRRVSVTEWADTVREWSAEHQTT